MLFISNDLNQNTSKVISKNSITIEDIKKLIKIILGTQDNTTVLTTGSSGRGEEYSKLDDIELLLYGENLNELIEKIKHIITVTERNCRLIIERKDVKKVCYFEGVEGKKIDKPIFFPSRFLDYGIIYGKHGNILELEKTFIEAIKHMSKSNNKDWAKRIRFHKEISSTGYFNWKTEKHKIYDKENKTLFYNKSSFFEASIKIGPLRAIQYIITKVLINLIKTGKITSIDKYNIGRSVNSRLDILSSFDINMKYSELTELKLLYCYFLNLHNIISKKFNKKGNGTVILDDNDFNEFIEKLDRYNILIGQLELK